MELAWQEEQRQAAGPVQMIEQWRQCGLSCTALAQASPDGRHCLNPADEWECQTFIDATDIEPLLLALGDFAKNDTFEFMDSFGIADMVMRHEFKELRASGQTYQNAIAELAEKHHSSRSTIERIVRSTSNRDTD